MKQVWIIDDAVVTPLGDSSEVNFHNVVKEVTGLQKMISTIANDTTLFAGYIHNICEDEVSTRFENLCWKALRQFKNKYQFDPDRTLFVLSTTKGNIKLIENNQMQHPRLGLPQTAAFLAERLGLKNSIVVSNACISGVMAIAIAKRYLQNSKYDHAIVIGADELTQFVVSGFRSLQALSEENCRPFDADRKGINLGEAAAALLLTTDPGQFDKPTFKIKVLGEGFSNDANHISGPSRTGEELALSIRGALNESNIEVKDVDFISAHGTATLYNDEMEAKAFDMCGFNQTDVHSLKGYFGHTLGAAGVLEIAMGIRSLLANTLMATYGFKTLGVTKDIHVTRKSIKKDLVTFLKTASGFGGCNAAMVLQKDN